MMKETFKNIFSFEFWQKFGKALMVVIAVMPAAGLMISIGKSIPMINPNVAAAVQIVVAPLMLKSSKTGPKAPAVP